MNAIICNCVRKPEKNSGLQRALTSNPVEVLNVFQASYAIDYNCVHNCEDQPSFDFISAVHMINFIYITFNFTNTRLVCMLNTSDTLGETVHWTKKKTVGSFEAFARVKQPLYASSLPSPPPLEHFCPDNYFHTPLPKRGILTPRSLTKILEFRGRWAGYASIIAIFVPRTIKALSLKQRKRP